MSSYDSGKKMKNPKGNRKGMTKKQESQEKGVGWKPKAADASRERKETRVFKETELLQGKMYMRIISWAKFLFLSIILA